MFFLNKILKCESALVEFFMERVLEIIYISNSSSSSSSSIIIIIVIIIIIIIVFGKPG